MCDVSINFKRPTAPIICFKVYEFPADLHFLDLEKGFEVQQVYQAGYLNIKSGQVIVCDRPSFELTDTEKSLKLVERGIHTFQSLRGAKDDVVSNLCNSIIVRAQINPEELLGKGLFFSHKCFVSTKIKILDVVRVGIYRNSRIGFFSLETFNKRFL